MSATILQFKRKADEVEVELTLKVNDLWPIGTRVSYSDMKNPRQIAVVVSNGQGYGQEVIFTDTLHKGHCPVVLNDEHLMEGRGRRAGWCLEEGIATQDEINDLVARHFESDMVQNVSRQDIEEKLRESRIKGEAILSQLLETRPNAKSIIVAELHEDQSDSQTDYYASRKVRVLVLAFSDHTRDVFSEMRKAAGNALETAYLVNAPKNAEHREKYSMGRGYYLMDSASTHSGWRVRKWEIEWKRNEICEILGGENNLRVPTASKVEATPATTSKISAAAKAWATRRARG